MTIHETGSSNEGEQITERNVKKTMREIPSVSQHESSKRGQGSESVLDWVKSCAQTVCEGISDNIKSINSRVSSADIRLPKAKILLGTLIASQFLDLTGAIPIKTAEVVIKDDAGKILSPSKVVPTESFSSNVPSLTEAPPLLQKLGREFAEQNKAELAIPTGSDVDDPVPTGDPSSSRAVEEVSNKNISDIPGMSAEAELLVQNSIECLSHVKSEHFASLQGDPKVQANRKRLLDDPELVKCLNPLFKDQKVMNEVEQHIDRASQNPEIADNFRQIASHKDLLDFTKQGIQEYNEMNYDSNQLVKRSDSRGQCTDMEIAPSGGWNFGIAYQNKHCCPDAKSPDNSSCTIQITAGGVAKIGGCYVLGSLFVAAVCTIICCSIPQRDLPDNNRS